MPDPNRPRRPAQPVVMDRPAVLGPLVADFPAARLRVANPRPTVVRPGPEQPAIPVDAAPIRLHEAAIRPHLTLDSRRFRHELLEHVRFRAREPVPRDQVQGPVAPKGVVDDRVLFEDGQDASKKLYLPRYRLVERQEGGRRRYGVRLEAVDEGGRLTVELEKYIAKELERTAGSAQEIPHTPRIELRFRLASGSFKELPFDAVEDAGNGRVRARLTLPSLNLLTQVFQVLQDSGAATELRLERTVQVAVPSKSRVGGAESPPPNQPVLLHREISARFAMAELAHRGGRPGRPLPQPPPDPRPRPRPRPQPRPEPTTETLYHQVMRMVPQIVEPEPFVFPPQLHDYVFSGVTGLSSERLGLVRRQVQHEGTWHSYYQDQAEPERFYYLPDAFKLARRGTTPFLPLMAVSFHSVDGSTERMEADLELVAVPELDPNRLAAAAIELARHLPASDQAEPPIFEPLQAQSAILRLFLPRRSGGDANTAVERPDALVDLDAGIHDRITFSLDDFQAVWDALFGASAVLMRGEVTVALEDRGGEAGGEDDDAARRTERIPFLARLDDLEGELATVRVEPAEDGGEGVTLALTNAIESPLEITDLPVVLRRDGAESPTRLEAVAVERLPRTEPGDAPAAAGDTQMPVTLGPGDTVLLRLTPTEALPGDGTPEALFSIDDIRVLPNKDAVWNAVLDPSTPAEYERTLEVRALDSWFREDDPEQAPQVILVQFERGDTVSLEPGQLEAETAVRLPLEDLILRRLDEGTYRYKVTVIRSRSRERHEEWIADSIDILFPELPPREDNP